MKLKLDDKGNVVLQDGKPVYVKDDGSEVAFDAAGTVSTIARLNGEAKGNRERAESAEGKLKAFDGIDNPADLTRIQVRERASPFEAGKLILGPLQGAVERYDQRFRRAGGVETNDVQRPARQARHDEFVRLRRFVAELAGRADAADRPRHGLRVGGVGRGGGRGPGRPRGL